MHPQLVVSPFLKWSPRTITVDPQLHLQSHDGCLPIIPALFITFRFPNCLPVKSISIPMISPLDCSVLGLLKMVFSIRSRLSEI